MSEVQFRNTLTQLSVLRERLDAAAREIVVEATSQVTRDAQANANTGSHKRGEGHTPGSGPGPNVVTGTLRRSIRPQVPIRTSRGWSGKAGPTVVYARAVELGHPAWKNGQKYPYLGPAIQKFKSDSTSIIEGVLRSMLGV